MRLTANYTEMRRPCLILLVVYTILYYGVLLLFPTASTLASDLFSLFEEVFCFAAVCYARRFWPQTHQRTWTFFAGGIALYTLGDFLWFILEIILGQRVPAISFCDVFYLTSCGLYLLALIRYTHRESHHFFMETAFNVLICVLVGTTLIFKYTILPAWDDLSLPLAAKLVSMIYPVFDLAFLAGMFSLWFYSVHSQKIHLASVGYIILSFSLQFIADQLYLLMDSEYFSGSLLDPLWPVSAGCIVLAALSPGLTAVSEKRLLPFIINRLSLLLPYLLTVILVLMINLQHFAEDPLIAGMTLTILVIILRQFFVQKRNGQLLRLLKKANNETLLAKQKLEQQNAALQQLSEQREVDSHTDFLTGLFNRRYMHHLLRHLPETADSRLRVGFMLIDVDFFKQINDILGHQAGDTVLHSLGHILRSMPSKHRIDSRFGGDEFLLVFQNTSPAEMEDFARQLMHTISHTLMPPLNKDLTLSIGMTFQDVSAFDYNMENLIQEADLALYEAKKSGRHKYVFYTPDKQLSN